MIRRLLILLSFIGLLSINSKAQNSQRDSLTITGRVVDNKHQPMDGCILTIIQEKDSFPAVVLGKNAPLIERMCKKTKLDMKKNVHDLATEYPEVIDIMIELGFKDISNPVALNTMGRVMTIPKGSQIKGIDLDSIVSLFEEKGFEVINVPELRIK